MIATLRTQKKKSYQKIYNVALVFKKKSFLDMMVFCFDFCIDVCYSISNSILPISNMLIVYIIPMPKHVRQRTWAYMYCIFAYINEFYIEEHSTVHISLAARQMYKSPLCLMLFDLSGDTG